MTKKPLLSLCAALLLLGATSPSFAQSNSPAPAAAAPAATAPAPAPKWALDCSSPDAAAGALQCQISLRFVRQEDRGLLMLVAIRKNPTDNQLAMQFVLPHGLNLPSGLSYQVDTGAKSTVAFATSGQDGTVAVLPLTPELLTTLKAGSTLNVSTQTANGNAFGIPVSLAGFTAAIDRLNTLK
ncbi:MAG TPA: invasion associated locus B family protein [Devosiaceae bacterium]|jgi:invasion protein IalB